MTRYTYPEPKSLFVCTVPVTLIVSPTDAASALVTVRSLVPCPTSPLPSWRWIQFFPMTASLYFTTLPRTVTRLPSSADACAQISAIVRASEGADHPTELTRDHLRLRDQLLALEPSARPADTTRALSRAAQLLSASGHARKTVYLLSLLAKTGMRPDDPPWGKDGPTLVVVELRPDKLANLAITALRVDPEPGAGTRGVAFDAEVANFGDAPSTIELSLSIADRVVLR